LQRTEARRLLILALFLLSGVSGLVYQIVWTRMLVLVFGNTILATSTVLSAFMGGLAAGSYFFGRTIDRRPRPLVKLYALLEAGIGLYALIFPLLLGAVTPLYVGLYGLLEGNLSVLNLARFAVCFALISVPTFLMGGTLPVLIKRFAGDEHSLGRHTGYLYGLNTVGAVVGTLACGYFLLKAVGLLGTTWLAVAINLGVAAVAWLVAGSEPGPGEGVPTADSSPSSIGAHYRPVSSTTRQMVLLAIGISGFCALAYEVFWTRMLNLFLNNNIYSFTAILATFLVGIAIGSLIYSRFLSRVRDQVSMFVVLEIGIGLFSYATPFVFNLLHGSLFNRADEALNLAKTSVIMIGPTILMGVVVPLAVQICQRGVRQEGTSVGTVYAVNTVGAILGAFAAGFVLLPYLGLHMGVVVVASLNIAAGFLPLIAQSTRRLRPVGIGVLVAGVATLLILAPADFFRGLFEKSHPTADILHYKEGKVANVVVYDFFKAGYKDLHLNAVEEASSRLWHVQLFKLLGILPPMLHDNPDNTLMIAFGAGMSAGACINYVDEFTCVDLNPDIDGVAEVFTRENLDVINHPDLNRVVNDGRNALLLSPQKYSLIISDATNPKMFDSWTLYTQEFYKLARQRLEPDGIFCQWVLIPLPGDAITVILSTLRSVFPHASFWCIYGSSQCLMLGTQERLEVDYQELKGRLDPIFKESGMAEFGIDSVTKFLSFFMLGEDELDRLLADYTTIGTDDLPVAQFQVEQNREGIQASLDLVRHQAPISRYLTHIGEDRVAVESRLATYDQISRRLHLGFLTGETRRYREAEAIADKKGLGVDANVISMLGFGRERKRYFEARTQSYPEDVNALNTLGFIYGQERRFPLAIEMLERAMALKPDFANAHANLAQVYLDAGMLAEAEKKFLELRELNPALGVLQMVPRKLQVIQVLRELQLQSESAHLHAELARAHYADGQVFAALGALEEAATLDPSDPGLRVNMGRMFESVDLPEQALTAYEQAQGLVPSDEAIGAKLGELRALMKEPDRFTEWQIARVESWLAKAELDPPTDPASRATRLWMNHDFEGKIEREQLYEVAALYEEAIDGDQDDFESYQAAAAVYELLGESSRAAELRARLVERQRQLQRSTD